MENILQQNLCFQKHVDVLFCSFQATYIWFICPQKQRCTTKSFNNLLSLLKNLNGFRGHDLSLDKQLQCNNSNVFLFCLVVVFFCHPFLFFLGKNILLFFLTGPQKWFDQIWSNTCFWSKLITYDFSFPRKKSDFFHCCVFLVGNKILLTVFQELSMGFGWKLFWVVNALLWNLSFFLQKKEIKHLRSSCQIFRFKDLKLRSIFLFKDLGSSSQRFPLKDLRASSQNFSLQDLIWQFHFFFLRIKDLHLSVFQLKDLSSRSHSLPLKGLRFLSEIL